MAARGKRPRLASARLLQSLADVNDDDDFVESHIPRRRPLVSRDDVPGPSRLLSASDRLNSVVQQGLSVVSRDSARPRELTDRFPFLQKAKKKRNRATGWKTVPCCLGGPSTSNVPCRTELDSLCREGVGTLWFTKDEDPLELELLQPAELHFLIVCLYPMLKSVPYEFCRAAGLGNKVIVPLKINDDMYLPAAELPFRPYFSVNQLKSAVGRRGRLYIRPLLDIDRSVRMSQLEVGIVVYDALIILSHVGVHSCHI